MEKQDVLKEATAKAITEAMDFVRTTADFATGQAPDLAQQLLAYSATAAWVSLAYTLPWFLISLAGVGVMCFAAKNFREDGCPQVLMLGGGVMGLGSLLGLIESHAHIMVLIKVYTAPKLFVLEKLASLL